MTNVLAICTSSISGPYTPLHCPAIDGYKCRPNELVKASRNALGNLYKYRINIKRSIEVSWEGLSHEDYVSIVQQTAGNAFWLEYWDMQECTLKRGKFYRGNDFESVGHAPFKDGQFRSYGVKMSFEEF